MQTRYRPDRDAELMAEYVQSTQASDDGPPVVVSYSIGTDREDLIRAWERATPSFAQRMSAIATLRRAGVWVVPTLSPFGLWNNLTATLEQFRAWDIGYITCLFFKKGTDSANTPGRFLGYLHKHYPMLLDSKWQAERMHEMQAVFGEKYILLAKAGFTSLTAPQQVGNILPDKAL